MATKIIEELIDDLDGSEAAETIRFGFDGAAYEVELSPNAAVFREAMRKYSAAGRRVGGLSNIVGKPLRRSSRTAELARMRS